MTINYSLHFSPSPRFAGKTSGTMHISANLFSITERNAVRNHIVLKLRGGSPRNDVDEFSVVFDDADVVDGITCKFTFNRPT